MTGAAVRAGAQALQRLPQGVQFLLVGGSAAGVHLLAVGALVALGGLAPLWANGLAFLLAFIVSYNGHARLTFARSLAPGQTRGWGVLGRFFAVACLSFLANEALYVLALHWLRWHYFWSQAAILVLVALGTFILSKCWAFQARPSA